MSLIVSKLADLKDGAPIWTTLGGETRISGIVIRSPDREKAAILVLETNESLSRDASPPLVWDNDDEILVVSRSEDSFHPIFDDSLFLEHADITDAQFATRRQNCRIFLSQNGLGLCVPRIIPSIQMETKIVRLPYATGSSGALRPSEGLIATSMTWRLGYRDLSNPDTPHDVWMFENSDQHRTREENGNQ